ncbi:MAG TPA: hypothetical protein VFC78_13505 [Tepidisphaeraceae bacterium]|nr:hypothetical protein [Tepidisphaeraceae bacterium]
MLKTTHLSRRDATIGYNLAACHACPRRQSKCAGACACQVDGRDIIAHAQAGDCPLNLHQPPASRGLGDTLAAVAEATGVARLAQRLEQITGKDCGCRQRQERLNAAVPYGRKEPEDARR